MRQTFKIVIQFYVYLFKSICLKTIKVNGKGGDQKVLMGGDGLSIVRAFVDEASPAFTRTRD